MPERYFQHTFDNGLTLLAERMPGMQSAAMTLLVPAGSATDPADRLGSATVLTDLVLRGAGGRDNKQLTDHLDGLGLQRSSSVGVHHTRFGCAALADKVMAGLPTYADIVRRATLADDGFEPAQDLALQSLAGIDDEPRQKLLIKLREWFYPSPYGRNSMGEVADLEKLTIDQCRADYAQRYHAGGAILAVAGAVDFGQLKAAVDEQFGDWKGAPPQAITETLPAGRHHHEHQQSEQTHIGIAYPSVPETHPDYYKVRMAVEVLSGGMSGRLFTEVREKRGLVYSVLGGVQQPPRPRGHFGVRRHQQRPGPGDAGLLRQRAAPDDAGRDRGRAGPGQDGPQGQHDHAGRVDQQPGRQHRPRLLDAGPHPHAGGGQGRHRRRDR